MPDPIAFPISIGTLPTPAAGTWRDMFPEFNTAPDSIVNAMLNQAALSIDPLVWGNRAGEGQAYLAADLLAIKSGGQFARLQSEKGKSTYRVRYDELCLIVAGLAFRVI